MRMSPEVCQTRIKTRARTVIVPKKLEVVRRLEENKFICKEEKKHIKSILGDVDNTRQDDDLHKVKNKLYEETK